MSDRRARGAAAAGDFAWPPGEDDLATFEMVPVDLNTQGPADVIAPILQTVPPRRSENPAVHRPPVRPSTGGDDLEWPPPPEAYREISIVSLDSGKEVRFDPPPAPRRVAVHPAPVPRSRQAVRRWPIGSWREPIVLLLALIVLAMLGPRALRHWRASITVLPPAVAPPASLRVQTRVPLPSPPGADEIARLDRAILASMIRAVRAAAARVDPAPVAEPEPPPSTEAPLPASTIGTPLPLPSLPGGGR